MLTSIPRFPSPYLWLLIWRLPPLTFVGIHRGRPLSRMKWRWRGCCKPKYKCMLGTQSRALWMPESLPYKFGSLVWRSAQYLLLLQSTSIVSRFPSCILWLSSSRRRCAVLMRRKRMKVWSEVPWHWRKYRWRTRLISRRTWIHNRRYFAPYAATVLDFGTPSVGNGLARARRSHLLSLGSSSDSKQTSDIPVGSQDSRRMIRCYLDKARSTTKLLVPV